MKDRREKNKIWYANNKEACKVKNKLYREKFPWYDCWRNAHARCEDPRNKNFKHLNDAEIICTLTKEEVAILWKRDSAHLLNIPSIDRIDPKENYEFYNCRFVEFIDDVNRRHYKDHFLNKNINTSVDVSKEEELVMPLLLEKHTETIVCRNCKILLISQYSVCIKCYPNAL